MSAIGRNSNSDIDSQLGITKTKFAESGEKTNYISKKEEVNHKPDNNLKVSTMHPGKKIRRD